MSAGQTQGLSRNKAWMTQIKAQPNARTKGNKTPLGKRADDHRTDAQAGHQIATLKLTLICRR